MCRPLWTPSSRWPVAAATAEPTRGSRAYGSSAPGPFLPHPVRQPPTDARILALGEVTCIKTLMNRETSAMLESGRQRLKALVAAMHAGRGAGAWRRRRQARSQRESTRAGGWVRARSSSGLASERVIEEVTRKTRPPLCSRSFGGLVIGHNACVAARCVVWHRRALCFSGQRRLGARGNGRLVEVCCRVVRKVSSRREGRTRPRGVPFARGCPS